MATTTIPWGDGSGDNIYLTYPSASGNQTVQVSSDANTGAARSKVVTFAAGNITKQLTVSQEAGATEYTVTFFLSSYIPKATDGAWYNLTGAANAYLDPDNNTSDFAAVVMTRGANAASHCYFCFDTSSIPANAKIVSVTCKARPGTSTNNTSYIATKGCVMCAGTTEKTPSIATTASNYLRTFEETTWTREEVSDIRIKLYGTRGTSNTSSNYTLRMYGAELTIKYQV